MKRFFGFFLIVFCFFSSFYTSYGISNILGEDIVLSENPIHKNTAENIQAAQFIEKYFLKYKKDLEQYREDYELQKDSTLSKAIEEIGTIIFQLRKIQTDKVEKEIADLVMAAALEKVKEFNSSLKSYLKNISEVIQEETRVYQDKIFPFILKIAEKLDTLIQTYEERITEKKILSYKENQLKKHLTILIGENKKLKNFQKFYFKNKAALLSNLKGTLLKIRSEISTIKSL